MKICIVSPLHGQAGCSTASIFISAALSLALDKRTCLTHTDFSSAYIKNCFAVPVVRDVTTSLTQVTKLIKTGSIKADDMLSYTVNIMPELYLYSSFHPNTENKLFMADYEFLIDHMTAFEHIVIDYDSSLTSEMLEKCLNLCDLIIIVVNQSNYHIEKGLELTERIKDILDGTEGKRILYLVNEYLSVISTYKAAAARLKVKPRELITLSYSPYIIKCSNSNSIEDCFVSAFDNDIRVASIKQDMVRAARIISEIGKG